MSSRLPLTSALIGLVLACSSMPSNASGASHPSAPQSTVLPNFSHSSLEGAPRLDERSFFEATTSRGPNLCPAGIEGCVNQCFFGICGPGEGCRLKNCEADPTCKIDHCVPFQVEDDYEDIGEDIEGLPPGQQALQPGMVSPGSRASIKGMPEALVTVGDFLGDVSHKSLPFATDVAEALFANLPELDGLFAVRGHLGTALCFHLAATNNQATEVSFFIDFEIPSLIEDDAPYMLDSALAVKLLDSSGDGEVAIQQLAQTVFGETADPFTSSLEAAIDVVDYDGAPEEFFFFEGPEVGSTPFGTLVQLSVFTFFTVPPGDSIIVRGGVFADQGAGGRCTPPAIRFPANGIFLDGFESGDTDAWSSVSPSL